jgi:hypothetical protein
MWGERSAAAVRWAMTVLLVLQVGWVGSLWWGVHIARVGAESRVYRVTEADDGRAAVTWRLGVAGGGAVFSWEREEHWWLAWDPAPAAAGARWEAGWFPAWGYPRGGLMWTPYMIAGRGGRLWDVGGVVLRRDYASWAHGDMEQRVVVVPWWVFVAPVVLGNWIVWRRWWRGRHLSRRGFLVEGAGGG